MNTLNGYSFNAFDPDNPVDPQLFAGRKQEIDIINTALVNTLKERSQHILVRAKRWLGKTSLVSYIAETAPNIHKLAKIDEVSFKVVFRRFGSCTNLDEAALYILNDFRKLLDRGDKVLNYVQGIKGLTIGPLGIEFADKEKINLRLHLSELVIKLFKEYSSLSSAYLYVMDEMQQLSHIEGSASLFKDLFEALNQERVRKIMFLVTATPQDEVRFRNDHESFSRLFRYVELGPLKPQEGQAFLQNTLKKHCEPGREINDSILTVAESYSSGFPGFLQEIGYWLFEVSKSSDTSIATDDLVTAIVGDGNTILGVLDALYRKHFRYDLEGLRSPQYDKILRAIAVHDEAFCSRKTLLEKLDITSSALTIKAKELVGRGILLREDNPIQYGFRNLMHRTIYRIPLEISERKGTK